MLGVCRLYGGCSSEERYGYDMSSFHLWFIRLFYLFRGRDGIAGTGLGAVVASRLPGLGMEEVNLSGWPNAVRLAMWVAVPSTVARVVPRRSLR